MPSCELRMVLDRTDGAFRAGEEVTGSVEVKTDGHVRCDGLDVALTWATRGKGDRASESPARVRLFEGDWGPLHPQRYPFRLQLPNGPQSYDGHYLSVGWQVRAKADIPWKLDPKAEVDIRVGPPAERSDPGAVEWPRLDELEDVTPGLAAELDADDLPPGVRVIRPNSPLGCVILAVIAAVLLLTVGPWVLFGLVAGGVAIASVLAGDWGQAWGLLFLIFPALILGIPAYLYFKHRLVKSVFGDVSCEVEPVLLWSGDSTCVRVAFTPRKEVAYLGAALGLRAVERVTRGSGTSSRTFTHTVHEAKERVDGARRLAVGERVEIEAEVRVPEGGPPSFHATRNHLEWTVELALEVDRWPDWEKRRTLVVIG